MKQLKRTIAIVCGGDSSEHDVSCARRRGYSFFDKDSYQVYIVDVKGTDWNVELPDGTLTPIDKNDFSFREQEAATVRLRLLPSTAHRVRTVFCRAISI